MEDPFATPRNRVQQKVSGNSLSQYSPCTIIHRGINGRFRIRVVLVNVRSFRFSFRGNIRRNHPFETPPSYGFGRYGFGFFGPRIAFRATGALWGRATPFLYHFSVHLSSVLGRTELCHEVWTPGPQKPQIISNENHGRKTHKQNPPKNPGTIL